MKPRLIITVPELLDKVNGFKLPSLLFCHQKNSNLSVATFNDLVDKAGYMNCDNCGIEQSDIAAFCVLPMFHVFGPVIFMYSQLQKGNTVVSMDKFDLEMIILRGTG